MVFIMVTEKLMYPSSYENNKISISRMNLKAVELDGFVSDDREEVLRFIVCC